MAKNATGSTDRLLFDEMFSIAIAHRLTELGIDSRAVVDNPHLRSLRDELIAEAALHEGRVLVTNNVADFEVIRRRWAVEGRPFPHVIYTSDERHLRHKRFLGAIGDALVPVARERRPENYGGVYWL